MPCCISAAQRTASATLANSASRPSPVVLTMRPWCSLIFGFDQLPAMRLEVFERAFLVRTRQTRIAHHIGGEDRGKTARRGHGCGSPPAPNYR
jgi:hypothetical protein